MNLTGQLCLYFFHNILDDKKNLLVKIQYLHNHKIFFFYLCRYQFNFFYFFYLSPNEIYLNFFKALTK